MRGGCGSGRTKPNQDTSSSHRWKDDEEGSRDARRALDMTIGKARVGNAIDIYLPSRKNISAQQLSTNRN